MKITELEGFDPTIDLNEKGDWIEFTFHEIEQVITDKGEFPLMRMEDIVGSDLQYKTAAMWVSRAKLRVFSSGLVVKGDRYRVECLGRFKADGSPGTQFTPYQYKIERLASSG